MTKQNHIKTLIASVFALAVVLSFQNCAEQQFSQASGASVRLGTSDNDTTGVITDTGGPNCRSELQALTVPVKTVFVVDVSGSNTNLGNGAGSDPNKAVRGGSMTRFFNSYSTRNNFNWTLISFARSSANTIVANSAANGMQSALTTFMNIQDGGETPYIAALDSAKNAIQNDSGRLPNTKYIVVFLSDGLPNPGVDQNTLNNKVREITGTVSGAVSFNAVYYGPRNETASGRLKSMAQTGGGNFLDTNANPTGNAFLISDLVQIPGVICQ